MGALKERPIARVSSAHTLHKWLWRSHNHQSVIRMGLLNSCTQTHCDLALPVVTLCTLRGTCYCTILDTFFRGAYGNVILTTFNFIFTGKCNSVKNGAYRQNWIAYHPVSDVERLGYRGMREGGPIAILTLGPLWAAYISGPWCWPWGHRLTLH